MRAPMTLVATITLLMGCASSAPFSQIEDDWRGEKANRDLFRMDIRSVDGEMRTIRPIRVEPGKRVIVAESLRPQRNPESARDVSFEFEAAPCVRYVLGALHRDPLTEGWEPVVVEERPIPRCDTGD